MLTSLCSCLSQWFNGNSTGRKKTCPECRAVVDHAPAPAYLVRDLVHKVLEQPLFCDEGETVEQHNEWRQEEARIVEKDRSNTHPQTGGLFHGRFKPKGLPSHLRLVRDDEDGVDRCPNCTWEIEDGEDACQHCGFPVDDDGSTDYDDEMTIDSMLRDELDEDMSLDDVELDLDMQLGAMVHPMNSMTRIQGRNSYPARTPDQIVDLVSESDSQSSTAEGRSISLGSRSGSDEDEDEDDDEPDEVDDTLMEGFVDDDPEGSDESEESEAPESSPRPAPSRARDKGARRGNPYIVESSEEESSDDEGGAVTRQPARRSATFRLMNRMFNNSPSTTGDDSSSED